MRIRLTDLPRKMKDVMQALDRCEHVTLLYRGKEWAIIVPSPRPKPTLAQLMAHPAFGMWKDRDDMGNPTAYVRAMRTRKRYA
jgi:hypothetical protein